MKRLIALNSCGVLLGLALFGSNLHGADAEGSCRAITDRFLQVWCATPTNGTFKEILGGVWYKPDEVDEIAKQTESQQERARSAAKEEGKTLAAPIEYLGSRLMGDNYIKLVYAEKLEHVLIPWSFLFYRPTNSWRMVGILKGEGAKEDLMAMGIDGGPDSEQPRQLADTFMKELTTGQEEEAFSRLVQKHWTRQDEAAEMAQRITALYRSRRALGQLTIGKPIPGGFETLPVRSIGKSMVRVVCLQKHEYGVVPLKAVFYKPLNDWTLYELTFGEGVTKEDMASATTVHLAK